MDEHEKLRLLYVALTRARDHLIVSCHHKINAACQAKVIWDHSCERPTLWRHSPDSDASSSLGSPTADRADEGPAPVVGQLSLPLSAAASPVESRDRWLRRRAALVTTSERRRIVSATALARASANTALARESAEFDDPSNDEIDLADLDPVATGTPAVRPRRRGRAGSAIGRAVHATLQALDLGAPIDIERQVRRQCDIEAIPDLADTAEAMVRSALASEALSLATVHAHHQELYVAAPVGDQVVEGYVDLLIETPDGLVIVDYKTDHASSATEIDTKMAAYERQGAAYALVLESVTGSPVTDCRFVFCRPRGAIERHVEDLPRKVAELRRDIAATAPLTS